MYIITTNVFVTLGVIQLDYFVGEFKIAADIFIFLANKINCGFFIKENS